MINFIIAFLCKLISYTSSHIWVMECKMSASLRILFFKKTVQKLLTHVKTPRNMEEPWTNGGNFKLYSNTLENNLNMLFTILLKSLTPNFWMVVELIINWVWRILRCSKKGTFILDMNNRTTKIYRRWAWTTFDSGWKHFGHSYSPLKGPPLKSSTTSPWQFRYPNHSPRSSSENLRKEQRPWWIWTSCDYTERALPPNEMSLKHLSHVWRCSHRSAWTGPVAQALCRDCRPSGRRSELHSEATTTSYSTLTVRHTLKHVKKCKRRTTHKKKLWLKTKIKVSGFIST